MSLPIKPVVDVYYNLAAISAARAGFNVGAIVGQKVVGTLTGTIYQSVDEMLEAGYASTDPEVLAAQVYFSATSHPSKLYVATWVKESTNTTRSYTGPISNGNIVTIGKTAYTIGDGTSDTTTVENLINAVGTAGGAATYTSNVLNIAFVSATAGSQGTVTALSVEKGTGSAVAEVITDVGLDAQTPVEVVQAMRAANEEWYTVCFLEELTDDQNLAIAAYIESASVNSTYFFITSSDDATSGAANNILERMKGLKYQRTLGIASKQPYTHVGAMGYAMGQTRTTANSSYTLALKYFPGVSVDSYTSQQVTAVENNYGNVYINRGSYYDMFERGKVFSGAWFDEIIQLDKLVNAIQLNVMDLLYQNPKIAQTEGGVTRIISKVNQACEESVKTGFIAPGQWNGGDVLELSNGDYLPNGYLTQAESIDEQSQADRDARKAPNMYCTIKLAGAIQSVVIEIDVNR